MLIRNQSDADQITRLVRQAREEGIDPIRVIRAFRGLSREDLAGAVGTSVATIRALEDGGPAHPLLVQRIAIELGVTVDKIS